MYWRDIGFDRELSSEDIPRGWAAAFDLNPEAIGVTPDLAEFNPWVDPRVRIAVVRWTEMVGEFPMLLTLVVRGEDLEGRVQTDGGSLEVIQRFCLELGCRALTDVEDDCPSCWILVTPTEGWHVRGYEPDEPGERLEDAIIEPHKIAVA